MTNPAKTKEPSFIEGTSVPDLSGSLTKVLALSGRNYLLAIRNIFPLTHDQHLELARLVRMGREDAFEALVFHNLKLVPFFIRRMRRWKGVELEDMIQNGNLGLMVAARKFDPDFGTKFSTYAAPFILQGAIRGIENTGTVIRVPVPVFTKIKKVKRIRREMFRGTGKNPTPEELAELSGFSLQQIRKILQAERLIRVSSMDADMFPGGDDEESLYNRNLVSAGTIDASVLAQAKEELGLIRAKVQKALSRFCPKERDREVFIDLYGIDDDFDQKTLEQVGQKFGLTKERIRQIVIKVRKAISRPNSPLKLDEFDWDMKRAMIICQIIGEEGTKQNG